MGNEASKNKAIQDWKSYLDQSKKTFQTHTLKQQLQPQSSLADLKNAKLSLDDFEFHSDLGAGAFAEVFLAQHTASKTLLALKMLDKVRVIAKGQEEHVKNERKLLSLMELPFIIRLHLSFQTKCNLCLGLEYVPGGELFVLLRQKGTFTEDQAIFFASQVIFALEYMHALDIVYRDLKPENILLDRNGYLKVADLGFAKIVPKRTYTMCGTPEYIAPEILAYKGYGKAVDWWALGVLIYEMLCGMSAFFAENEVEIYDRILAAKVRFPRNLNLSRAARHLIKHLLEKDLTKRYGTLHAGVADIREHAWFSGLDWEAIFKAASPAPFKINVPSFGLRSMEKNTRLKEKLAKLRMENSDQATPAQKAIASDLFVDF